MSHSLSSKQTIEWAGLHLPMSGELIISFSKEQVDQFWGLAIDQDDVSLAQSLIRNGLCPSPEVAQNEFLIWRVLTRCKLNIFEFLIESPFFQDIVKKEGPQWMEQCVSMWVLEDQKVLTKMIEHLSPFWLGENQIQSQESGETLPFLLLSRNLPMIQGQAWKNWLTQDHVFPAVETPNHKGQTFFEYAYRTYNDWFLEVSEKEEKRVWLEDFKTIEKAVHQKRYGKIPKASQKPKVTVRL